MPTLLRVGRYRFFFFSNEGQEPRHVHVEAGESWAKFWLDPVSLADSRGFRADELRKLREITQTHAVEFRRKWNEHFAS